MTNLFEILINAPQGLKLYSPVFGKVYFQDVGDNLINGSLYPIIVIDKNNKLHSFTENGGFLAELDTECVLFPSKEHRTWDNWQEVLFQKGDVIVNKKIPVVLQTFLCYGNDDRGYLAYGVDGGKNYITPSYYRYSTPEEREQFFKELNDNGYTWNDNSKQMEKSLQQNKHKDCLGCDSTWYKEKPFTIDDLKPFNKVLIRNSKFQE